MPTFQRGTHFAEHVIVRLVGAGRTAEVYEVVAPDGARRALKVHRGPAPLAARSQRCLGQDGNAIATIEHVNVIHFYTSGIDEGRVWLLIELVDGPDLLQLVRAAGGKLPLDRAVRIVRQACEGVATAHAHGILHRDLRPEKILVAGEDLAKVADFGSTRLEGWGVETSLEQDPRCALYMAPEQMKTRMAGPWSDVYSMGVILYEIVAGASPFGAPPAPTIEICRRHLEDDPPPLGTIVPDVPSDLSELLQHVLAKAPAARPTMRAFADALSVVLRHLHTQRRFAARSLPLPNRDAALALTERAMPVFHAGGTIPMPAPPGPPARVRDPDVGPWPGVAPPPQASTVGTVSISPAESPSGREAVPPPPPSGIRVKAQPSPPVAPSPSPPTPPTPRPARGALPATLAMHEVASPVERRSSGAPVVRPTPPPAGGNGTMGPALAVAGGLLLLGLGAVGWLLSGYGVGAPASAPPPPPTASASAAPSASASAPVHGGGRKGGPGRHRARDAGAE